MKKQTEKTPLQATTQPSNSEHTWYGNYEETITAELHCTLKSVHTMCPGNLADRCEGGTVYKIPLGLFASVGMLTGSTSIAVVLGPCTWSMGREDSLYTPLTIPYTHKRARHNLALVFEQYYKTFGIHLE